VGENEVGVCVNQGYIIDGKQRHCKLITERGGGLIEGVSIAEQWETVESKDGQKKGGGGVRA